MHQVELGVVVGDDLQPVACCVALDLTARDRQVKWLSQSLGTSV